VVALDCGGRLDGTSRGSTSAPWPTTFAATSDPATYGASNRSTTIRELAQVSTLVLVEDCTPAWEAVCTLGFPILCSAFSGVFRSRICLRRPRPVGNCELKSNLRIGEVSPASLRAYESSPSVVDVFGRPRGGFCGFTSGNLPHMRVGSIVEDGIDHDVQPIS
jgi:hypothetical protein